MSGAFTVSEQDSAPKAPLVYPDRWPCKYPRMAGSIAQDCEYPNCDCGPSEESQEAIFIKAGDPLRKEKVAAAHSSGRLAYIEHRCRNCLGRGWFGREEEPWNQRCCRDCAGLGWISEQIHAGP